MKSSQEKLTLVGELKRGGRRNEGLFNSTNVYAFKLRLALVPNLNWQNSYIEFQTSFKGPQIQAALQPLNTKFSTSTVSRTLKEIQVYTGNT